MLPADLLKTAELLAASPKTKPSQANLRRAISTSYYAMFHALARNAADLLIGGPGSKRSKPAWRQVYRSLEHNQTSQACRNKTIIEKFPQAIKDFADTFVVMQSKRHAADYDPIFSDRLAKSVVIADIDFTRLIIDGFSKANIKDKRAFCAFIIFKTRS